MTDNELIAQLAGVLEKQTAILEGMAKKESHEKNTPAMMGTNTPLLNVNGVFATPGLDRTVLTAMIRPTGISSVLPAIPTVVEDPRFATITGFTDVHGNEPANVCNDAPSGYMKGCNLTARFGLVRRDTETIDLGATMRRAINGDTRDLILRGMLLSPELKLHPSMDQNDIINLVVKTEMINVGIQTQRVLSTQIWQGVTTIANQFRGLDSWIATGHRDADSNVLCPAMDSDVKSFAYDLVGGTGRDIVEYLAMLEYYLYYNAERMGLDPVNHIVVMRPELWEVLSNIWPCALNAGGCANNNNDNNHGNITIGSENVATRDAMRAGMYIDINGRRHPVVVDTGIFEHTNINNANLRAGQYASSIYIVPLTVTGGFPVCYREYLDYSKGAPEVALLNGLFGNLPTFWTDSGSFSWAYELVKWCIKLSLRTEQRIILRAPQLAGRIDAVKYAPLQHLRDPNPASPYFADGGVSVRNWRTTYLQN